MPIFTITYELRNGQYDYKPFANELKAQKCFQIMGSTCLGSFDNTATQVHNHFRKFLDKGDSLLVSEMYQHYAYTGHQTAVNKWLELNPPAPLPGTQAGKAETGAEKNSAKAKAGEDTDAAPKRARKSTAGAAKATADK